jgi:hypothetical protein
MKNRTAIPLVLLLITASFMLGVASVLAGHTGRAIPQVSPALPSTSPIPDAQTSILILGVDQLDASAPRLLAIWLLTYRQPASSAFLLGLPLDFVPASGGRTLEQRFSYNKTTTPPASFLQAIGETFPLPLDAIVLLDQQAYATVIDFAGGIELNGSRLTGQQVISVLSLVEDDPRSLLRTQEQLLQAMALRAPGPASSPDIAPLLSLLPDHASLSVSVSTFTNLLMPVLSLDPQDIHIDLPTLPATPSATAQPNTAYPMSTYPMNTCLSMKVRLC